MCQDFEANIGHITRLCPNKECTKCGIKGHFAFQCEAVASNEENHKSITIMEETCSAEDKEAKDIKTENFAMDQFSQSEEMALMYSLNPILSE